MASYAGNTVVLPEAVEVVGIAKEKRKLRRKLEDFIYRIFSTMYGPIMSSNRKYVVEPVNPDDRGKIEVNLKKLTDVDKISFNEVGGVYDFRPSDLRVLSKKSAGQVIPDKMDIQIKVQKILNY